MVKKIVTITLAGLLLGGCSVDWQALMGNKAATDTNVKTDMTSTEADTQLEAMPSPGVQNDDASLETDINSTTVLEEDFSDLN